MSGVQWLASYPRSGNTWLRLALSSLSRGGAPVRFAERADYAPLVSDGDTFEEELGVDPGELTADEAEALRPRLHAILALRPPPVRRVHDAWLRTPQGEPLFPSAATACSIYIVRDPRDVAVSLAHYLGLTPDRAIALMANPAAVLSRGPGRGSPQLPIRLSSWSGHVESWRSAAPPPLIVRYKDMVVEPAAELARVAGHLGWATTADTVAGAVAATRFEVLSGEEARHGFAQKPAALDRFFRRGRAGGWRDTLSTEQAARIERDHGAVMTRLGYR